MSLINKPIEEVISFLFNNIQSKKVIIESFKSEYKLFSNNLLEHNSDFIQINRLKIIDLLNEFEITISQSLQCIQTLQAEIFNLKENKMEQNMKDNLSTLDNKINEEEEYILTQKENNISIISGNSTNSQQIYQKPKTVGKTQTKGKLNFDYSNIIVKKDENKAMRNERYKNSLKSEHFFTSELDDNDKNFEIECNKDINKIDSIPVNASSFSSLSSIKQDYSAQGINSLSNLPISPFNDKPITLNKNSKSVKSMEPINNVNIKKIENIPKTKRTLEEQEPEVEELSIPKANKNNINNSQYPPIQREDVLLTSLDSNNMNINQLKSEMNEEAQDKISIQSKREILINKVNQIQQTERIMEYLSKISLVKSYKNYLSGKYGNGKYDNFLGRIRNNQIDLNLLEKELKIIFDLIQTDIKHSAQTTYANTENPSARSHSKGKRNVRTYTPRQGSINKEKTQKMKEKEETYEREEYEAPLNFADILRGGDSNTKRNASKKRNSSKSSRSSRTAPNSKI